MRIVIDMQGAQTDSRFRGIGRYSLSLVLAMLRHQGEHEIWLVLNGAFPESALHIRNSVKGLLSQDRVRVFNVPLPVAENNPGSVGRTRVAELIREHFLQRLDPDVILLTSLFEGFVDNAVTSVGEFASGYNTAVILYDLIPYLYPEKYLPTQIQQNYYARKINSLKNSGLLLSISESARNEAIQALAWPSDNIANISTAVDDNFRQTDCSPERIEQLRAHYGIERKMVLYVPGGFDTRKNFEGLIQAYALLSEALRQAHQLVIASKASDKERYNLLLVAKQAGLKKNELVLTGYVPAGDLIALYNLATLFVFVSKHEGFGLSVLEAMCCGAPVIGSDTASIPEVIGLEDALFDPYSPQSIAQKMDCALSDELWRNQLREHGLRRAQLFSWDATARRTFGAFEAWFKKKADPSLPKLKTAYRPKLAYISPLPPERSGISDYSAELLPELALYFDIDVIVAQPVVSDPWITANCQIRSVEWFSQHAAKYERIIYHFGNSPFHSHMFGLLRHYPGVVVLHDFFLGSVLAHEEMTGNMLGIWTEALYHSHGYQAVQDRFSTDGIGQARDSYPVNLDVLQNALGVIVHSEYSQTLANQWYGACAAKNWEVIPLLRAPAQPVENIQARHVLGFKQNDFIVCSFGLLGFTKLNQRLLDAWLGSLLSKNKHCHLVFVGENNHDDYGVILLKTIKNSRFNKRIRITGWMDMAVFRQYLAIADIAVQLRTLSRGETSAAVLDCMNYGLPTIVNANGAMADLPKDAVWRLPDAFTDAELINALETLWQDSVLRQQLAIKAREVILMRHDPAVCAEHYARTIEFMYRQSDVNSHSLIKAIAGMDDLVADKHVLEDVAQAIAMSCPPRPSLRHLLVDVSSIARHDLKTGIERVVRAQLMELVKSPPKGFRVEPVYLSDQGGRWHYRYATSYMYRVLGLPQAHLCDSPIDIRQGDIFYGLDFCPGIIAEAAKAGIYLKWQVLGVSVIFLVYDLLPILQPNFFPDGAANTHAEWLKAIVQFASRLVCISSSVADELRLWINKNIFENNKLIVDSIHLGADIAASSPSIGLPDSACRELNAIGVASTFLMVGTIEPRKGHWQVLEAFERLWSEGYPVNLVIVGKEGWLGLPYDQRRTIPKIVSKLRNHNELGHRLFWLEGISDEYLERIYAASTCLIAASEGEGFGLPLIEAAQHQLPIIARDIPVFREVAGRHAYYFSGLEAQNLADAIKDWLALNMAGNAPQSNDMPWLDWRESTRQLLALITKDITDE